ncbi:MAG TPA: XRE family transcriptional regulator [Gemmataceae bacterium]|jgi:transcriptional regulator with XRE-family HTH domain|nr:XRE family transcriptional regulator [Gemmataceae bacterium]
MAKKRAKRPRETSNDSIEGLTSRMCERLRKLRIQRGWTLNELAAVSGVSRSMLSQIERAQVNPTLAVAYRIARAFDRSLGDLVDDLGDGSLISIIRSNDPTYIYRSDHQCRIRTMYPMQLEKTVEFYEVWLAPKAAMRSAPHYKGTRELLTVGEGTVTVHSGEFQCEVSTGDSAHYPADVPHAIENMGTQEAVLYLIVICRTN